MPFLILWRNRFLRSAILLAAVFSAIPALQATGHPVDFTIDAGHRAQTIQGFGACLAWWSPQTYRDPAWQKMYYQDLGATVLRMDLLPNVLTAKGDGVLAATPVLLGSDLAANLKKFNFTPVAVFGEVAQAARRYGVRHLRLIASVWSPPPWMKVGGTLTYGSPQGNACGGHLRQTPENREQYARYLAAYVTGFARQFGVPLYALSIQNELELVTDYNSCQYDPASYVATLKAVAREFRRDGIKTFLIGPECCGIGNQHSVWNLWKQMQFINAVRADPEAMADLAIYAVHGYAHDATTSMTPFPDGWRYYLDGKDPVAPNPDESWRGTRHDGKPWWQTELSGEQPRWLSHNAIGPNGALALALNIHNALVVGDNSLFCYWLAADGQPVSLGTLTTGADTTAVKYCAAKQFFKYIRPGAVRLVTTPDHLDGILLGAYFHAKNRTLTLTLINAAPESRTARLRLPAAFDGAQFSAVRTSGHERCATLGPLTARGPVLTCDLPAKSLVTLQAALPAASAGK